MFLLATGLRFLDLVVFRLEATSFFLSSKDLLYQCSLSFLVGKSAAEVFRWTFNDRPHLRKFWYLWLRVLLLVESLWVKDVSHSEELQIPLELWSQVGSWQIVPVSAGSSFLFLIPRLAAFGNEIK